MSFLFSFFYRSYFTLAGERSEPVTVPSLTQGYVVRMLTNAFFDFFKLLHGFILSGSHFLLAGEQSRSVTALCLD